MKTFVLTALAFSIVCTTHACVAKAALAPDTIKEMKDKAANVFNVEIVEVKQGEASPKGRIAVEYQAKVLDVVRSKSGIKAGDTITINLQIVNPKKAKTKEGQVEALVDLIGPKQPTLLTKGWRGKVYLNSSDNKKFGIAVFGHSFE